ncbi:small hydrophobic protein [Streptomyces sp. NBC_01497]|uniref:small hydrophobic protein n=1 Tax=Streptomyces sp. NBC_01497 TaxID=2903885 RepID=UPI002E31275A|nr:small hydrophobic protein [Streptomyces sp. NBC_01497]
MAGFGSSTRTRMSPRSRGRMGPRNGPDRATFGIIGIICAIAGFFVLGIVLGPIALITGWLSMNRQWSNRHIPAVIAVVLGAIDTVLALITLF